MKKNREVTLGKKDGLLAIVPFLILAIGFGLKSLQLESPHQSFADAHIALQLSKGWLEGRPLLYDTYYGHHDSLHNYFFVLLLGPVTWLTGIYGLFLTYLLLTGFLFYRLGQTIITWRSKHAVWISLVLMGLGPIAYLVFVDVFGWHPEQYYVPLMGLSAFFLAKKKWIPASVFLLLTATVKESAPILLGGLLLFASITDSVLEKPAASARSILLSKRTLLTVLGSVVVFFAGMALLSFKNAGPSRLMTALRVLMSVQPIELINYLIKFVLSLILFFVILVLPFIPILKKRYGGNLLIFFLAFYLLVLGAAFFVEGLLYFPDFDGGLPYPTRAGSVLAFFFSSFIYLIIRIAPSDKPVSLSYSLWSTILQVTLSAFLVFHSWSFMDTRKDLGKLLYYVLSPSREDPYNDPDRRLLKKIAAALPRGAEVVAPEKYLSIFQKSYGTRPERQEWLLGQPILYVGDQNAQEPIFFNDKIPETNYKLYKGEQIHLWINVLWESQLMKSLE